MICPILTVLVLGLTTSACTAAMAPEVESQRTEGAERTSGDAGPKPQISADPGPVAPLNPPPGDPVPPALPGPGDDGDGDASGDDAAVDDGSDDGVPVVDLGAVLGTVSGEATDLAQFVGKSTYALSLPGNGLLSITVLDSQARDKMFRKVKSYECKACNGADDVHCKAVASKSLSITFMKSFLPAADHKVDVNGYPKQNDNALEGNFAADSEAGMTLSNSLNPTAVGNKGTVKFVDGKRPAKTGDAYEADVDLIYGDGKKYKAKISGKVFELPSNPTPPTCESDEYLDAIYQG